MSVFLWGAATSSHQIEGRNVHNDWWAWEQEGHIEGGVRSGAATDHWNRFAEDLRLAADLGLNAYRFSIEWSRIEPREGEWDETALDWYSNLVDECLRLGLAPMATLHHFTSPRWFADKGGFAWEGAPERFAAYAERVAERLGSRVLHWCTLNEPMVLVVGGYLGGFMPPAERSPGKAASVCRNLLRAHVRAYDILRAAGARHAGGADAVSVGIAHNLLDFRPDRSWHPLDRVLTWVLWKFYNQSWLDAVTGRPPRFGVPFLLPGASPVIEAQSRRTVDFIGVNYYTKAYLRWQPRNASAEIRPRRDQRTGEAPQDLPIGLSFARRNETSSDLGWAIHARGFRRILRFVARYRLPIYVTENGIADREDRLRPAYLMGHLRELALATREGIDIRGYFHWSLLDNFEWVKGFWPRFGLYRVDYSTFERTPTETARLYRKIVLAHSGREGRAPDVGFFGE